MKKAPNHNASDFWQYIPKPVGWFESRFDYSGKASIQVQNNRLAEGFALVEFDGRYRPKIHFRYDPKSYYLELLSDPLPDLHVKIECASGVLTTEDLKWNSVISYPFCPEGNIIISPPYVKFTSHTKSEAKHWALPLLNFISKRGSIVHENDPLNIHPLRVFSPWSSPNELDSHAKAELENLSKHARSVIAFSYHNTSCFIERLPDYEESVDAIRDSSRGQFAITALMVGSTNLGFDLTDIQELMSQGPIRFEDWLFFATGSSVIAPWIEYRDDSARLISRIHFRRTVKNYTNGKNIIGSLGELLTAAARSDKFGDVVTKSALNRIAVAGQSDLFIEDRKINLFVASDSLTQGIRKQQETSTLGEASMQSLTKILEETNQRILAISGSCQAEMETLKRIANRVRDAARQRPLSDAIALMELARRYGLQDSYVINQQGWKKKFTEYRGKVIHEGYFDPQKDATLDNLVDFMDYLQDLLVRIVLKSVGYQSHYRPPTARHWVQQKQVDWVTHDSPPEVLGF